MSGLYFLFGIEVHLNARIVTRIELKIGPHFLSFRTFLKHKLLYLFFSCMHVRLNNTSYMVESFFFFFFHCLIWMFLRLHSIFFFSVHYWFDTFHFECLECLQVIVIKKVSIKKATSSWVDTFLPFETKKIHTTATSSTTTMTVNARKTITFERHLTDNQVYYCEIKSRHWRAHEQSLEPFKIL